MLEGPGRLAQKVSRRDVLMVSGKSTRPEALLSQSVQERRKKYDHTIPSFLLARARSSGGADNDPDAGSGILGQSWE
jgi:hypothetical protein